MLEVSRLLHVFPCCISFSLVRPLIPAWLHGSYTQTAADAAACIHPLRRTYSCRHHRTSFRQVRQPFGGKRCIVSRLPLPRCCENGYCTAHLEKPTSANLVEASDESLKRVALKIVFAQHDADGSG